MEALKTPVLLLIFNRPEETAKVFEQIRLVRPKELFIAADGPRQAILEDKDLCEKTRRLVSYIDWDCKVKTFFRASNVGCGENVRAAITWFFEHVEEGIILEDDCFPSLSFFYFCQKLLEKYKNNKEVMMISGNNFLEISDCEYDYFFSYHNFIWGWATWRRAWNMYDYYMSTWQDDTVRQRFKKKLFKIYNSEAITRYMYKCFDDAYNRKVDTWDYQWSYAIMLHNGLSIIPKMNLVSNIGIIGAHMNQITSLQCIQSYSINIDTMKGPLFITLEQSNNKMLTLAVFESLGLFKKKQNFWLNRVGGRIKRRVCSWLSFLI